MPEETAESPQKTQKKTENSTRKNNNNQRNSKKKNTQDTRKQRTKKQPLKKIQTQKNNIKKHTPNKFWYHQHNIQHTRHYNCNYTGVDTHIYKCIDKRQYSDIVSCKYGSIATRIGDCVCQT